MTATTALTSRAGTPASPSSGRGRTRGGLRAGFLYATMSALGMAAFLYPFFLPATALPGSAHSADAPLLAAGIVLIALAAIVLELHRHTMTSATVAVLGVLTAMCALLRLLDLPGGGSGIFFLVILAGAAFGPRFGLLLGLGAMALSAVLTGGLGPWLPFQMLTLGWIGAGAGFVGHLTRNLRAPVEVGVLALYGWCCAFLYGAVLNLWFWPFQRGGSLAWEPGSGVAATVVRYVRFYVATSFAWDAAGAIANATLIVVTGTAVLFVLRRVAPRLDPVTDLR